MTKKENIKDLFMGFEPEVDTMEIDRHWEKIKYFVPKKEEKKRSPLFFWLTGLAAILLLGSGIGISTYFFTSRASVVSSLPQPSSLKTIPGTSPVCNNSFVSQKVQQISHQKSGLLNKIIKHHSAGNFSIENTKNLSANTIVADKISASVFEEIDTTYYPLETLLARLPDTTMADINFKAENIVLPEFKRSVAIDIFTGTQQQVVHSLAFTDSKTVNTGFHFGLALNYQLKHRLSFMGQFVLSKSGMTYSDSRIQNKILPKKPPTLPTSSLNEPVPYVNAETVYTVSSHSSFDVGIALDYCLFQKGKFQMNTFLSMDIQLENYKYGYTKRTGADTLQHVTGTPDSPYANAAPPYFENEDVLHSRTRLGLGSSAGICLGYRITSKVLLTLRPSYSKTFTENTIVMDNRSFSFKQQRLFLSAGLRFNL
ncbi:MAG: hypothetical protein K0S32_2951 [Bacteroidetes bacterium]|nr:hypothetical protein [Bacteroidota bacterium]